MKKFKRIIEDNLFESIEKLKPNSIEQYHELKDNTNKIEVNIESIYDPFEILNRNKYAKLTHDQLNFLKQQLFINKNKIMLLSRIYRVSPSTLSKIKNSSFENIHRLPRRNIVKINDKVKAEAKDEVEKYYIDQEFPFTVRDVQNYLMKHKKINISYKEKNIILKNDWNLTFKRVQSRQNITDMNKVRLMRKLFSIKISNELNAKTLVINWDEW